MKWEGWVLTALFVAIIVQMLRDPTQDDKSVAIAIITSSFFVWLVIRLAA